MKKVMVAMSGGVDSSVAAAVLCDQNYEVIGATLKLYENSDDFKEQAKTCCALDDVRDARQVAGVLNFPHYVLNFKEKFNAEVIQKFVDEYLKARTPNPCIYCNRYVKFEYMIKFARSVKCDFFATGHYAMVVYDVPTGRYLLKKSADKLKDQTYVLYFMKQEQLAHTIFPLTDIQKVQVRNIAEKLGFGNSKKRDSQDICFVKNSKYVNFIKHDTKQKIEPGNFLNTAGQIVGKHRGIINYTIGQRKGLGITFGKSMYVIAKHYKSNTVILGEEHELYSNKLAAGDTNFIAFEKLTGSLKVEAKIRYNQLQEKAVIHPKENGYVYVEFASPQRAIAPGQAVVFYDHDVVIGGGVIL